MEYHCQRTFKLFKKPNNTNHSETTNKSISTHEIQMQLYYQ